MIPGLTTRSRLPRLGKIRLGEKRLSKGGKEYPAALDHFRLDDVPEVEEVYGKECRELSPVILPHDDEEVWFPTARKAYRRSGLFCACDDGETARRVYVPVTKDEKGDPQGEAYIKQTGLEVEAGDMFELPCPGEQCPYFEQGLCKNVGRLMIMLPRVPRFGVYEITTSSYNSILNVLSTARAIRSMAGRICGIPLALRLGPQQVQGPDGKAKTVHVLSLEFRGSLWALEAAKKQLGEGRVLALIEGGKDLTPDDLYPKGGDALDTRLGGNDRRPIPGAIDDIPPMDDPGPAPPPGAAEEIVVCGCPCGHQLQVAPEWAASSQDKLKCVRCPSCYPGREFAYPLHSGLKSLEIRHYADGLTPLAAEEHRKALAKPKQAAGAAK